MLVRQVLEGCNEFFVDVDAELAMSAWGERERLDVASQDLRKFDTMFVSAPSRVS